MRLNGLNGDKILSIIILVMATLFFMPVVGMYLICKKDSSPFVRTIGAVLLVVGVMIMLRAGRVPFGA